MSRPALRSGEPVAADRMTPCTPAIVGSAKAPSARVTAPMSIVRSGLRTSTNGAVVRVRPLFCPAPNPGFDASRIDTAPAVEAMLAESSEP